MVPHLGDLVADWVPDLQRAGEALERGRGFDVIVVRRSTAAPDLAHSDPPPAAGPESDDAAAGPAPALPGFTALSGRARDTPIIALTDTREDGVLAVAHGFSGFVTMGRLERSSLLDAAYHAVALHSARAALRDANERLMHADRLASIGQLTAGVAHEINNPAASLLANLTAMKNQLTGARDAGCPGDTAQALATQLREWADILDESIAGIGHIRSIVRDLRNFSRVDAGAIGLVDLNRAIEEACKITDSAIRPRASLHKQLGQISPVRGDYNKLVQVFTNLLSNAAHAITGPVTENHIRVATGERDGLIIVVVEDTGCGIPEDARKLVFEPFFTTKPRDIGNGLGLALSAEIIHNYGGEIGFGPRKGGGTRFEVHLAANARARAAPALHPILGDPFRVRPTRPPRAARPRVLLIDDEPTLLRAFRRLLAPGHEVVMAANGQQALDILATDTAFDGVICDFSMPDIDGIAIYDLVAGHDRELADRIVFCTGGVLTHRGRTFIESTSNTVLEKPVPPEILLGAIEQLGRR